MTELLQKAIETAQSLAPAEQDEIARVILELVGSDAAGIVELSDDEKGALAWSKAAAARGEFASDEQVARVWAKYGL